MFVAGTIDSSGNLVFTGNYRVSAVFAPDEDNETTITTSNEGDSDNAFLAKYNGIDGRLIWAIDMEGSDFDRGVGLTTDEQNNIYISGLFEGSAVFGEGETNETIFSSVEDSGDIFIAKFNSEGDFIWARKAGGASFDRGSGIVTDEGRNVYLTGFFEDQAVFGNEATVSTGEGIRTFFVAKYAENGDFLWVKQANGFSVGGPLAFDSGRIYALGLFIGSITLGSGEVNSTNFESVGWN